MTGHRPWPRRRQRPAGPLCRAWELNGPGTRWDGCEHDSCWAIVAGLGGRP